MVLLCDFLQLIFPIDQFDQESIRYKSQDFPYLVQMTLLCLKKDDKFVLWKHIRLVYLKNNTFINCKLEETVAHRLHRKILSRKGNEVAGTVCFEVRIIFSTNQFDQESILYKSQDFPLVKMTFLSSFSNNEVLWFADLKNNIFINWQKQSYEYGAISGNKNEQDEISSLYPKSYFIRMYIQKMLLVGMPLCLD